MYCSKDLSGEDRLEGDASQANMQLLNVGHGDRRLQELRSYEPIEYFWKRFEGGNESSRGRAFFKLFTESTFERKSGRGAKDEKRVCQTTDQKNQEISVVS
jgi:hypothetical protein